MVNPALPNGCKSLQIRHAVIWASSPASESAPRTAECHPPPWGGPKFARPSHPPLGGGSKFAVREFRGGDQPLEHENKHQISHAERTSGCALPQAAVADPLPDFVIIHPTRPLGAGRNSHFANFGAGTGHRSVTMSTGFRAQKNPRRKRLKHAFARHLRSDMTDAERKLWSYLRRKQVHGLRFRRQQPIGPYVADFYCPAARLIVELDGGQHGEAGQRAYDEARTKWLESEGFHVLRIANVDFLRDRSSAIDWIWHAIETSGCPLPGRPGAGPLPDFAQQNRPSPTGRAGQ